MEVVQQNFQGYGVKIISIDFFDILNGRRTANLKKFTGYETFFSLLNFKRSS